MTPNPSQALLKVFQLLDRDGGGVLAPRELHKLIANIPNLAPLDHMSLLAFLYESDSDGDGCLTFEELRSAIDSDRLTAYTDE